VTPRNQPGNPPTPECGRGPALSTPAVVTRHIDRLLAESGHPDPIKLGGSPHARLPAHMLEAARALPPVSTYATSRGIAPLREVIADTLVGEGMTAAAPHILVTNGAMHAIEVCFGALLRPGDGVVMPSPGYFIDGLVRRAGATLQTFPSPESEDFRPDWDAAEQAVTAESQVLFLNSPVNPTGYVYTDDDLERAWRLAKDHDLWIISDESYSHFLYRGRKHRSILELDPARERTILIRSFSKDYAMPGWRLGYAALPAALVDAAAAHLEWSCLSVNHTAQMLGIAAMTGPQDWINIFVRESERRAELTAPTIARMDGLRCVAPQGGLNVLVGYDGGIDAIVTLAVTQLGFAIQPGAAFGAPGYFRFQFGGTDIAVRTGLDRLALAVRQLREQSGKGAP
jgi:aspartate/methionine/tyrosine aminotransferase